MSRDDEILAGLKKIRSDVGCMATLMILSFVVSGLAVALVVLSSL